MIIKKKKVKVEGIKFSVEHKKEEMGRAFLYILRTEPEKKPYGLIGGVFVSENWRSQGIGTELIKKIIAEARRQKCYKIVLTCRNSNLRAHKFYQRFGFKSFGKEFRIDYK